MKKQTKTNWKAIVFPTIATVVFMFSVFTTTFAQEKSISERYGSRDPRTCEDTKAPASGAITAALALKYLNCQLEDVAGDGDLYLVENVKVEVGGGIPYAAIRGQYSLDQIDVNYPVYPIRGSLLRYQCKNRLTAARMPDANCITYNEPKATGHCYKTKFGDWRCDMNDPDRIVRHDVPPPKGGKAPVANQPVDPKTAEPPVDPKNPNQTPKTNAGRDENDFPKPDFSEMEKYFEIVKYDYNPVDGRVTFVVKAKKLTNIFRWVMAAYDADGVKINEDSFNGNVVSPAIGEPTRIYSFAPNEKDIRRVARIVVVRKLD